MPHVTGIFTYICLKLMVNLGKYSSPISLGIRKREWVKFGNSMGPLLGPMSDRGVPGQIPLMVSKNTWTVPFHPSWQTLLQAEFLSKGCSTGFVVDLHAVTSLSRRKKFLITLIPPKSGIVYAYIHLTCECI